MLGENERWAACCCGSLFPCARKFFDKILLNICCDRLKEDLLTQTRELSSLQTRYKEVQILYSDAQSKELSQQFELSKVSRDRDLLVKQVARLEQEIQQIGSNERSKVFECNEKVREFELRATTLELDLAAKIKENSSLKVS